MVLTLRHHVGGRKQTMSPFVRPPAILHYSIVICGFLPFIYLFFIIFFFIALPEKGFSAAIFKYILKILHELKIEKI